MSSMVPGTLFKVKKPWSQIVMESKAAFNGQLVTKLKKELVDLVKLTSKLDLYGCCQNCFETKRNNDILPLMPYFPFSKGEYAITVKYLAELISIRIGKLPRKVVDSLVLYRAMGWEPEDIYDDELYIKNGLVTNELDLLAAFKLIDQWSIDLLCTRIVEQFCKLIILISYRRPHDNWLSDGTSLSHQISKKIEKLNQLLPNKFTYNP